MIQLAFWLFVLSSASGLVSLVMDKEHLPKAKRRARWICLTSFIACVIVLWNYA